MSNPEHTLLLLDGNALLHRAWHAIPPLTTKDGTVVNAAYGFTMILEKMLDQYDPDYMVVAWDLPGETFRHELFEEYKAHRETKEQELYDQIPIIQEILDVYGIMSLSAEGYEADDIIGTLAAKASKKGIKTQIVTGDLDQLQLVTELVEVLFFQKGISQIKVYDIPAVQERYGFSPKQLIDYKALRGDPSDNIPGVQGIGDKTATLLVQEYASVDGILQALESGEIVEKFAKKLRGNEQVARDSRVLVEIVTDVPVSFHFSSAKVKERDTAALAQRFRELEFRTLVRKYSADIEAPPFEGDGEFVSNAKKKGSSASSKKADLNVIEIEQVTDWKEQVLHLGSTVGISFTTQQENLFGATIGALCVSDGTHHLLCAQPSGELLKAVGESLVQHKEVVVHDYKRLLHETKWSFKPKTFDVMLAAYLLHSNGRGYDLPSLANEYLQTSLAELPASVGTESAKNIVVMHASVLPALRNALQIRLEEDQLLELFTELESPLVSVLYEMESNGIAVDRAALSRFSSVLTKEIKRLQKKITSLAGEEFNLNSPSQLATVLFETLALPTRGIKKTKTGYSTAASELEKLWSEHEIIPLISEYREKAKLQSTYVDALPKLVKADGRIHTTFHQTVAATGRLSSADPNLQNIPIRTELGNEIRKAFVAPKGRMLIAADYSQIELRLASVIAKDEPFIHAFQEGADIHTRTAAEVWEVSEGDVTKDQRRAAKAINFGILYGMGPRALARSTGLTFKEAKAFIAKYFEIHHAIKTYMEETKVKAHEDEFVETLFGRRRYLPEISSGIPPLVAAAERMAINMPVQGTQADVVKKAMLAVHGWLQKSQWPAKLLLQVHDELVLEVDEKAVDAVAKGVKEIMEGVAQFDVPLAVNVEIGQNWGELTDWN